VATQVTGQVSKKTHCPANTGSQSIKLSSINSSVCCAEITSSSTYFLLTTSLSAVGAVTGTIGNSEKVFTQSTFSSPVLCTTSLSFALSFSNLIISFATSSCRSLLSTKYTQSQLSNAKAVFV
jgi:hypothetical protein